ncbi:MAG: DUF362 domain-containing protein [Candidatus Neomarinimicrobiota bacterium]
MSKINDILNRREFIVKAILGGFAFVYGCKKESASSLDDGNSYQPTPITKSKIALHKTQDRKEGVHTVMDLLDFPPMQNKHVVVKPNFNTSDPAPASTHNNTLRQLITEIKSRGVSDITLAERSYQSFNEVITEKGIQEMADELGFNIQNLNSVDGEYTVFNRENLNWDNGFRVPNIINEAEYIVATCCLKTHHTGVITMSLKLGVGILPAMHMDELHSSLNINSMIAEINLAYKPDLIVMDGVKAFISGGPSRGTLAEGNVILAGTDRIAIDAVGSAILIELGSTRVQRGHIFELEQINRAVELGIGINSPLKIEFVTANDESRDYAEKIREILVEG